MSLCLPLLGAAECGCGVRARAKAKSEASPGLHFNHNLHPSFLSLVSTVVVEVTSIVKVERFCPWGSRSSPAFSLRRIHLASRGWPYKARAQMSGEYGDSGGRRGLGGLGGCVACCPLGVLYSRSGERTCYCLFVCGFDGYPYHALFIQYFNATEPRQEGSGSAYYHRVIDGSLLRSIRQERRHREKMPMPVPLCLHQQLAFSACRLYTNLHMCNVYIISRFRHDLPSAGD